MTGMRWPIAELLPHAGTAILLDAVVACTDTSLTATVTIGPDSPFHRDNGIPAYVGIEYMAQACGAYSGFQARRDGKEPRIGFILGTRRYAAKHAWFADGADLAVHVELVYRDDEIGMFDCTISDGNAVVAQARLTVAEPKDAAALLRRENRMDDG